MEHFNMHHWSNEHKQTRENVFCNMNGVKECKKNSHSIVRQYSVKNSRKCIKTILKVSQNNMFNKKLQNCQKNLASNLW